MSQNSKITPDELRARRKSLGMTQSQFAEAAGVDRVTVARWETGKREIDQLIRFALQVLEGEAAKKQKK